jgi:Protein of unknown function (DUF2586)
MPAIPTVNITVVDNGASAALSVPQSNVQLKVGCAIGGTVNQPFATTNPQSLQTQFIGGPLVEAGGLVCQAGNVCIAVSIPIVTKGSAYAVQPTVPGGSSSAVTVTLDGTYGAWDTYYVRARCLVGGTIGTPGIVIQISLDAGRNYGAPISLGAAASLYLGNGTLSTQLIGGTGVQINFGSGTMVAGDFWQFGTVGPQGNAAGIEAALAVFQASQYGVEGVGSIHVVGDTMHGTNVATDIAPIQTQLQAGVAIYEFQRAITELRDAAAPAAWGGSGETEATWISNLQTAVAGLTAEQRVLADGGNYNMTSPFANPAGGLPAYRRNLAWAHAVRRTQIPLQRRAGRVRDGAYQTIVVSAATDPTDGFIYHDERVNPGLNASRIASAMTWPKKGQGFFQCQEPLLSPPGSQFTELVIGNVLDAACDIGYATGVEEISDDLTTQANGTLDPTALAQFQGEIQNALNQGMIQTPLVSKVTAIVTASWNVLATGVIPLVITVTPKAYANSINETINLSQGS